MSIHAASPQEVLDEDVVWPTRAMGGLLGGACSWFVRADHRAASAARRLLHRQLTLWQVRVSSARLAEMAVEVLLLRATSQATFPLVLEVARRREYVEIAIRAAAAKDSTTNATHYIESDGASFTIAFAEKILFPSVLWSDGPSVIVRIAALAQESSVAQAEPRCP